MSGSGNGELPLRFGLIADIHFSLERALSDTADLKHCFSWWRERGVASVLQLGDLVVGEEPDKEAELRQVTALLEASGLPFRHIVGNHCLLNGRDRVLHRLGLSGAYYSFLVGGFRFLVLDTMDVSVFHDPTEREDRILMEQVLARPGAFDYCGAIGIRQREWIVNVLQRATVAGEHVIVCCHHPLLPETTAPKYGLLWNHREVVDLLCSFSVVKVVFGGHYHVGASMQYRGVCFLVLPAFVARYQHPDGFRCGMLELLPTGLVVYNQRDELFYECSF